MGAGFYFELQSDIILQFWPIMLAHCRHVPCRPKQKRARIVRGRRVGPLFSFCKHCLFLKIIVCTATIKSKKAWVEYFLLILEELDFILARTATLL